MKSDKMSEPVTYSKQASHSKNLFENMPRRSVQKVSDDSISEKSKESDKSAIDFRDKEANRAANPFPSGFVAEDDKPAVGKDAKALF